MNKIILIGKLDRDPEPYLIRNGVWQCEFTIEVERSAPDTGWKYTCDIIPCRAHRHHAEFLQKFRAGDELQVEGVLKMGPEVHVLVDNIRRLDRPYMMRITCSQDLTGYEAEERF